MRLEVFQKYQNESDNPFMCSNPDHEMNLVPFINNDLQIELKCFFPECSFNLKPGLTTYQKILDKQSHD